MTTAAGPARGGTMMMMPSKSERGLAPATVIARAENGTMMMTLKRGVRGATRMTAADGRPRRRRDRDRDEDDDDDYRRRARCRYRDDDDDGDDDDYYRRKDIGQDAGMRMLLPVGRSLWAIAAGYLGLVSVLCVPAPLAMICGIIALIDIQSDKKKHGLGRAIFGLIMGVIGSIGLAIMIVAFLAKK